MTFVQRSLIFAIALGAVGLAALGQALPAGFPEPVRTPEGVSLGAWQKPATPARNAVVRPTALPSAGASQPRVHLLAPDLEQARAEDAKAWSDDAKGARRISLRRPLPVPLGPGPAKGFDRWQTQPDGSQIWTCEIESDTALGLRLHFANVRLPAGGELWVFGTDESGESSFSGPHDLGSLHGRGEFWSGTVFAQRVTVECRLPAGVATGEAAFQIDELLHRYVGAPPRNGEPAKAANACNIDVTCEPAWLETSKAVAGLGTVTQAGELFCTACLLNDTDPAPGTDYIMTANHCVGSQASADDVEFYWFYQTDECNGQPPSLITRPRTLGGADFIAGSDKSLANDFAFLRLRQSTPQGVVYAAWTTTPLAPYSTATGIHHPDGDYKRISFGQLVEFDPNYLRIIWSQGITEPGSSGSPLFNAAKEFVGQLFGGMSSCATPNAQDIYGRFDHTFPLIENWLLGHPAAPTNDALSNALILEGAAGSLRGSSAGATAEDGEPQHAGARGGKSVWYRWTASQTTNMTFTTTGSEFNTLLAVYTGDSPTNLVQVAANNDGFDAPLSVVSFPATAGTTYLIAVDGYLGAAGRLGLDWHMGSDTVELPNDNLASATVITGERGTVGADNRGATKEPGEPDHAGVQGGASIWFRWTAPVNGQVTFDTEGSLDADDFDLDTVLAVYEGDSIATLGPAIAEGDDIKQDDGILTSSATFSAVAGTTYYIVVDGFSDDTHSVQQGRILLNWQPLATPGDPPLNDSFDSPTVLVTPAGSLDTDNLDATKEPGEPNHTGNSGGRSVWFRWTAPANGLGTFDTAGSDFDSLLAVYAGNALASLTPLAANDDADRSTRQSRVTIPVTAGTVYQVAVDGYETPSGFLREGDIHLNWAYEAGGQNDAFSSAQVIAGLSGRVSGENRTATLEVGEPRHANNRGGASVWYRWTAPQSGSATIDTLGSSFDTVLGIYTGTQLNALTVIAQGDDISLLRKISASRAFFAAVAGQEYRIAVDGYRRDGALAEPVDRGNVVLNWEVQATAPELRLTWPALGPGGFTVTVEGLVGDTVKLQKTSNWSGWTDVTTTTLDNTGKATLTDPNAVSADAGFYRVIRQ